MSRGESIIQKIESQTSERSTYKAAIKALFWTADSYHATSVIEFFRVEYFQMLAVSLHQLGDRVMKSPGTLRYYELEGMLESYEANDTTYQISCAPQL